jgi:hypothetical protein
MGSGVGSLNNQGCRSHNHNSLPRIHDSPSRNYDSPSRNHNSLPRIHDSPSPERGLGGVSLGRTTVVCCTKWPRLQKSHCKVEC